MTAKGGNDFWSGDKDRGDTGLVLFLPPSHWFWRLSDQQKYDLAGRVRVFKAQPIPVAA